MPSFDLVSKLDMGEMKNATNQALKEIRGRYDFKGSKIGLELFDDKIELKAEDEYKIKAALDILRKNMGKRNLGMRSIDPGDIAPSGNQMYKQTIGIKNGLNKENGKLVNKLIKGSGLKVSSSYLDEKVRVTGKKIDDLQSAFSFVKDHNDVDFDLQMENMKR